MTTGIVLTGGASRRMGSDKAFVVVGGRPMAVAVADALWEGGCHPVECQGGDVDRLVSLGLTAVADSRPGGGPVAAIVDALERADGDVVVAACDLPDLDGDTVRSLTAGREAPAAYARTGDRAHLLSAWSPSALEALRPLVASGSISYRAALEAAGAVAVDVDPARVRNVNGPDDLEA